ncbi:putative OmpR family two-component system response regulator [Selenomonas ruminantium subsp. lactilytica TAM6421]|uniref:Putative OmpR family two-component system response regulator n=1 Tax=Selenomonas ruminantium subsp. lactilytica (strain NBRC 103574 / TAM6421) TaxID=927704 RepID=I0GTL2_SELRL|nr:response regulator transcription factor [Selenomonas ruminantium]BAL84099.1 putative OmpR family two-component system response regulator [Selenomonas ruminantium subsp. lactilytica TAM6421]
MVKPRIFIVEDERRIARFLQIELEHEGYETATEDNGRKALDRIVQGDFDLVLLDVMLPEMDGMEICRKVREISDVPIIMLTARDDVSDMVSGLDLGADDYITKPFDMQELLARIRRALRSHYKERPDDVDENERLTVKDLIMIPSRFEVRVKGEFVQLTKKEYTLLEYLLRNKRNVLSREQILQAVWGYDYNGDTNVVDVYIRYLRSKIDERFQEKYIHTVRGIGYAIRD